MPRPASPARFPPCAPEASRSARPGVATPERSPLMSAAKTGTPLAASCSARPCSVRVLPVPVAPATSPWRFIMPSGMRICADGDRVAVDERAEVERRGLERVALDDRLDLVGVERAAGIGVDGDRRTGPGDRHLGPPIRWCRRRCARPRLCGPRVRRIRLGGGERRPGLRGLQLRLRGFGLGAEPGELAPRRRRRRDRPALTRSSGQPSEGCGRGRAHPLAPWR